MIYRHKWIINCKQGVIKHLPPVGGGDCLQQKSGCFFATLRASSLVAQELPWERRRRVWSGFMVSWPFWDWMRMLWLAVLWRNKAAVGDFVLGAIVFVCSSLRSRFSMIPSHFFFCLCAVFTCELDWLLGESLFVTELWLFHPSRPQQTALSSRIPEFLLASLIAATKGRLIVLQSQKKWLRESVVVLW